MIHESVYELRNALRGAVRSRSDGTLEVLDEKQVRVPIVDALVRDAVFATDKVRDYARWTIWELGQALGAQPASIHDLYMARGRGECDGFTVPAVNVRVTTYYTARAAFRAAIEHNVGAFIFEISRSEIGYTDQKPAEYAACVIAAAIREGYRGPLFIQGDHFQFNAKKYAKDPAAELNVVQTATAEALAAGFYNIDVDASTLVDLKHATLEEQQRLNYELSVGLTRFIREREPKGVTVSIGGEIGEVGGKNSTEEELLAYLGGYNRTLKAQGNGVAGLSKVSIQTGTKHGGFVLPDGTLAKDVALDFDTLEHLSKVAQRAYGLSGAVQHGASTLPEAAFDKFPATETAEIHLATGFQNLLFDHPALPAELKARMYRWAEKECADERTPGESNEQFYYKTRKKSIGPFKAEWWGLPADARRALDEALEEKFAFFFRKLAVTHTADLVSRYVKPPVIHRPAPDGALGGAADVAGLAD
ncbi:MAG: aldolase [Anaerolineae bacterium]|nr:aldolase [Anaerolineae bacterium]